MMSPRSRLEYDEFNKYHFGRLRQERDRRAITPKVGEEPLNRDEVVQLRAELRSPAVAAEIAERVRSPEVLRPTDRLDQVSDILHDAGRRPAARQRLYAAPVRPFSSPGRDYQHAGEGVVSYEEADAY